ncbi:LGFP repeat-containing protein [Microbacterium petrolearium]
MSEAPAATPAPSATPAPQPESTPAAEEETPPTSSPQVEEDGERAPLTQEEIDLLGRDSTTDQAILEEGADSVFRTFSLAGWNPGNIISDSVFFASGAMTAAQIQSFLNSKGNPCQSGYVCLKDYRQSTPTRAADNYCPAAYSGSSNETAATIIAKVAQACGINPQVLLVVLQKEQSLVTRSNPGPDVYKIAMGYACPDTAPCDERFYGFFNQVYSAARQFKVYGALSGFRHNAGQTVDVYYHPDAGCGTSRVYIENKATAALYNYTPYQPNAAALAAGWGTGDRCSSYGNRNFYNYFTDWFGPTRVEVKGAIGKHWQAIGGVDSVLGSPKHPEACGLRDGGCYQNFENGQIHFTHPTGAHATWGEIAQVWKRYSLENGKLRYPTNDQECGLARGGCEQTFQGGVIASGPSTAGQPVWGAILTKWRELDRMSGKLGYPKGYEVCGLVGGGCYQNFEYGQMHFTHATGARGTWGGIATAWKRHGLEHGDLGYPRSDERCGLKEDACYQEFQRGAIYWRNGGGSWALKGAIFSAWTSQNKEHGRLGYPTSDEFVGSDGVTRQTFQGGEITFTHATGAVIRLR